MYSKVILLRSLVRRRFLKFPEKRCALVDGVSGERGQRVAGFFRVGRPFRRHLRLLFGQILVGCCVGRRHPEQVMRMTGSVLRLVIGRSAHCRRRRRYYFGAYSGRQIGRQKRLERRREENL